jgi:hypothetical protein
MSTIEKTDCIKVNDDKSVYVRKSVEVYSGGKLVGHHFRQQVVNPGDDFSQQEDAVKVVCAAEHTPEVVEAFAQGIQSQQINGIF